MVRKGGRYTKSPDVERARSLTDLQEVATVFLR